MADSVQTAARAAQQTRGDPDVADQAEPEVGDQQGADAAVDTGEPAADELAAPAAEPDAAAADAAVQPVVKTAMEPPPVVTPEEPDETPEQSRLAQFVDTLKTGGAFLWDNKAWVLLLIFFGLFVYFNLTRYRPSTEDIPALWNTSIKKLGVEPIYPPQEGVMVGDVYLMVAPIRPEVRGFLPDFFTDTFTGRSIKVGQIDLVPAVLSAQTKFKLPETKFNEGQPADEQDGAVEDTTSSTDPVRIRLYDVAFPKVVISRTTDSNAAVKWFTAAFADNLSDSISFNKVQTFAAPSLPAMLQLQEFCNKSKFCANDKAARRMLSYALGSSINQTYRATDGVERYVFDIEIFAVTQVFATRKITVNNNVGWTDDLKADLLPAKDASDAAPGGVNAENGSDAAQADDRVGYRRVANTGLSIDATFQRPVIFAYRKVGIVLLRDPPAHAAKE